MAFTRQLDDPCETKKRIDESTGVLGYLLDPTKYYNHNPCFIEKGIVGGNAVSLYAKNMVDLESDLTGRTRAQTKCPSGMYLPGTIVQGTDSSKCQCGAFRSLAGPCGKPGCVQRKLVHLPSCNMINYKKRVNYTGIQAAYPAANTLGNTLPPKGRPYNTVSARAWTE